MALHHRQEDASLVNRRTFLKLAPRQLLNSVRGLFTEIRAEGLDLLTHAKTETGRRVAILNVSCCLAWGSGECQLCYLQCPLRDEAVVLNEGRPTIVSSSCNGCGVCVDVCRSVNDLSSIQLVYAK